MHSSLAQHTPCYRYSDPTDCQVGLHRLVVTPLNGIQAAGCQYHNFICMEPGKAKLCSEYKDSTEVRNRD